MSGGRAVQPSADERLIRRAAIRLGWQLAAVAAGLVLLAVFGALIIEGIVHSVHPPGDRAPHPSGGRDADDGVLRIAMFIAGAVAVGVSGLAGFLLARRAVAPLGQALALQRRFVADAGHELRTPLTILHTRAQLAARRIRPDDPARPEVQRLLEDSRVLGEIVTELLESVQLGAGNGHTELVDVADLARDVVADMHLLADRADVRLVAAPAASARVSGIPSALRRALTSLIDNALGHTPPGGLVTVEITHTAGFVQLRVIDTGDGPGESTDRLVERFARGTGRPAGPAGRRFGLGLALVREVAVAHGGTFRLQPHHPAGAVAVLQLPDHSALPVDARPGSGAQSLPDP